MLLEDKQVSQTAIDAIVGHSRNLSKRTHSNLVERVRNLLALTSASQDDISRHMEELHYGPPDFFEGSTQHICWRVLLESFTKKHMNYIVSDTICCAYTTHMCMLNWVHEMHV